MMIKARSIRVATFAILAGAGTLSWAQGNSCPASPVYSPDFTSNQNCMSLNGLNDAYTGSPSFEPPVAPQPSVSTVLRLTANQGDWETSAWYQTPQIVANGFSTTFSFQLGSTSTYNADGIAFVIQNSSLGALGPAGCGIGFGDSSSGCAPAAGGILNSVAIEFNTFPNGAGVDPSGDDVTIQNCGGAGANSVDLSCSLKYNDLTGKINLTDGAVHVAAITYTASAQYTCGPGGNQTCSTLDVVLDGVDLFPGGVLFDITTIGLTNSAAYVGFTAGTGGGNDDQDILSWTFTPQGQTQTGTIGQTSPTKFNINGGFVAGSPTSGYDFTAQETDTSQQLQMVVTAIPTSQQACNALVRANPQFKTAECLVYQNGGGLGQDTAVLLEVTCPPAGSCGSKGNPFDAQLGTDMNFNCSENVPLQCGPPPAAFSFGFPNLTSADSLPEIGFLKGEGPDSVHPCTPNANGTTPLFASNQIQSFALGDTSGGAHGGSGGTTSCWVLTYSTQNETPTINIAQPVNGAIYTQGESDGKTQANYSCSALNAGAGSPVGPYLSIASCSATDTPGTTVANGAQFDTATVGPHTFAVEAQDSATNTNTQTVTYTIGTPPVITTTTSSATFMIGSFGSVTIRATGFPVPALTEAGALPHGVTFVDNRNGTGTLSGVATAFGIFPITFTAQNGVGSPSTLTFTLTIVSSVPASGQKCNGIYNGTFKGNITIASGQSCAFVGGGVTGNITESGGTLSLTNVTVGGNVQIGGGTYSIGPLGTIKGNLVVQGSTGGIQGIVCGAAILGNLQFQGNSSPVVIGSGSPACPGNTVGGNLVVNQNSGTSAIYNNTVGGSLFDQNNSMATQVFFNHVTGFLSCQNDRAITGGGNTAIKKQGQCATF